MLEGVRHGIKEVQLLYENGYEPFQPLENFIEDNDRIALGSSIRLLDMSSWLRLFRTKSERLPQFVTFRGVQGWRIIDTFSPQELLEAAVKHVMEAPRENDQMRIVVGASETEVPTATFGKFVAIERMEIEAFQSARALLRRYVETGKMGAKKSQPLSLAVFGPPGSGKSFGVKELCESVSDSIVWQNCNLAQFSQPSDLVIPLLKARDAGENKVPVVFFDEFDSKLGDTPLGWLRYLLQPMQDGEFKHNEEIRKLGKVIFIFAGGTSSTFREFSRDDSSESEIEQFRLAKGPDFVSRLAGYIDTVGIEKAVDRKDDGYVLRRAILLRSLLARDGLLGANKNCLVDEMFVRRLLQLSSLKHGARSLDQLLKMCIGDNGQLRLPAIAQLEIHLDRKEAEILCSNVLS